MGTLGGVRNSNFFKRGDMSRTHAELVRQCLSPEVDKRPKFSDIIDKVLQSVVNPVKGMHV